MHEPPLLIAIVPAAGVGARAAPRQSDSDPAVTPKAVTPKQYRLLAGQPMLRRAVRALLQDARITRVVVAVTEGDPWAHDALQGMDRVDILPCGGATRADTVRNTLAALNLPDDAWTLVHDAARPGLSAAILADLIDTCLRQHLESGTDKASNPARSIGGLVAMRVADTIKSQEPDRFEPPRVATTVPRDNLWQAQTPQMFPAGLLRTALDTAVRDGTVVTDEASAIEALGHAPCLVPGSLKNFKLTWPEDFDLMERWIDDKA
jgi:2-C-methyl-D-erythritol 4-phosphate cytidylyltransferase